MYCKASRRSSKFELHGFDFGSGSGSTLTELRNQGPDPLAKSGSEFILCWTCRVLINKSVYVTPMFELHGFSFGSALSRSVGEVRVRVHIALEKCRIQILINQKACTNPQCLNYKLWFSWKFFSTFRQFCKQISPKMQHGDFSQRKVFKG